MTPIRHLHQNLISSLLAFVEDSASLALPTLSLSPTHYLPVPLSKKAYFHWPLHQKTRSEAIEQTTAPL